MAKHTLSEASEDVSTRFLERDGSTLSCPFHICYDKNEKGTIVPSNASCGDWCPQFDLQETKDKKRIVYLLCGSGNAAYTIE